MKKFFLIICAFCLFLAGCNDNKHEIRIGMIKYLNVTEEVLDNYSAGSNTRHIFFQNLNTMIMALKSGQIDVMSTYQSVARCFVEQNPEFEWITLNPDFDDAFCFAFRENDGETLKNEFNNAILQMYKDGTLVNLVKKYISETNLNSQAAVVDLPVFYDDSMVKIGVTGDLPMLDYIRPDGQPAGFNTAVLAEISKRIGKNFVLVQIEGGGRALALDSKQIDVIFWAVVPKIGQNLPSNIDKPDGMILSEPYFSDDIVHVRLRR